MPPLESAELLAIFVSLMIGESPRILIAHPACALLLEKVDSLIVGLPSMSMPPPSILAELLRKVQLMIVGEPKQ